MANIRMKSWIREYVLRIGLEVKEPSLAYLKELQESHILHVPFENTKIMAKGERMDQSIRLEVDWLVNRIVYTNRGGYCFELNGLFGELLRELGFQVTNLAALMMGDEDYKPDEGIIDHMVLAVDLPEGRYYADVGAGTANRAPLKEGGETSDVSGKYRLIRLDESKIAPGLDTSYTMALQKFDGGWKHVYIFSEREFQLKDYQKSCYWMETTNKSHFTERLLVSLATEDGRKTISGNKYVITHGESKEKREILDEDDLESLLVQEFGITGILPPFGRSLDWEKIVPILEYV